MHEGKRGGTSTRQWRRADVLELGWAVVRQLAVGLVVALLAAAGWGALSSGTFGGRLPITLVATAVLMPALPSLPARRNGTTRIEQVLGTDLSSDDATDTGGLTAMGTVLFVSLPMVALAIGLSLG